MRFDTLAALTLHDVKNRLATLAARAESRGDTETLACALDTAAALTQLLALYRAETGSLAVDIDAHAPGDLAADLVREVTGTTRCRVECRCAEAPALWFYDQALIRMVLSNALHNALRFARDRVTIAVAERDPWLEFEVCDDGPGYPAAVLADVAATPFSRSGTGLGLQLTGRVAALHEHAGRRGELRLANDCGAVFTLLLPR